MTEIKKVGIVSVSTAMSDFPIQVTLPNGNYTYCEKEDPFSSGDVVYQDYEDEWHLLECGNCGIQPFEGDDEFICPSCNAIFR